MKEIQLVSIYELSSSSIKSIKTRFKSYRLKDGSLDYERISNEIDKRAKIRIKAQELISELYLDEFDIYKAFYGKNKKEKINSAERFLINLYSIYIDRFIHDREFFKIVKVIEYINLNYSRD